MNSVFTQVFFHSKVIIEKYRFNMKVYFSLKTLAQVFLCEFCKIFKKHLFYRTPLVAASISFSLHLPKKYLTDNLIFVQWVRLKQIYILVRNYVAVVKYLCCKSGRIKILALIYSAISFFFSLFQVFRKRSGRWNGGNSLGNQTNLNKLLETSTTVNSQLFSNFSKRKKWKWKSSILWFASLESFIGIYLQLSRRSHNYYYPVTTKHISDISKGSLKPLHRLAYLRRSFPAINHRSVSLNSSKIESCSFPRASS